MKNYFYLLRRTILTAFGLIVSAPVLVAETGPLAVSKSIVISALPYTISAPGTYVLNSDLTFPVPQDPGAAAITISTALLGPVVLDLRGHTITAIGGANQNFGISIGSYAKNKYPITIKNGTVQNFQIGADAEQGNLFQTTKIAVTNVNFTTLTTIYTTFGVKFLQVSDSNVSNCSFAGTVSGITDGSSGGNNRYLNNTFINGGNVDVSTGPHTFVIDCEVSAPVQ